MENAYYQAPAESVDWDHEADRKRLEEVIRKINEEAAQRAALGLPPEPHLLSWSPPRKSSGGGRPKGKSKGSDAPSLFADEDFLPEA